MLGKKQRKRAKCWALLCRSGGKGREKEGKGGKGRKGGKVLGTQKGGGDPAVLLYLIWPESS